MLWTAYVVPPPCMAVAERPARRCMAQNSSRAINLPMSIDRSLQCSFQASFLQERESQPSLQKGTRGIRSSGESLIDNALRIIALDLYPLVYLLAIFCRHLSMWALMAEACTLAAVPRRPIEPEVLGMTMAVLHTGQTV